MNKINKTIILVGDNQVGKTCILSKLIRGKIEKNYKETWGADFSAFDVSYFNQIVTMNIWDTSGEEDYRPIIEKTIWDEASGIFIICSYDDYTSMESLPKWVDFIKSNIEEEDVYFNLPVFVLLNKADLSVQERKFNRKEVKGLCCKLGISDIFETSIYSSVNLCFDKMAERLLGRSSTFRKSTLISETTRISLNKGNDYYSYIDDIYILERGKSKTNASTIQRQQFNNLSQKEVVDLNQKDYPFSKEIKEEKEEKTKSTSSSIKAVEVKKKSTCCF